MKYEQRPPTVEAQRIPADATIEQILEVAEWAYVRVTVDPLSGPYLELPDGEVARPGEWVVILDGLRPRPVVAMSDDEFHARYKEAGDQA